MPGGDPSMEFSLSCLQHLMVISYPPKWISSGAMSSILVFAWEDLNLSCPHAIALVEERSEHAMVTSNKI
jgi:hypothetical protein